MVFFAKRSCSTDNHKHCGLIHITFNKLWYFFHKWLNNKNVHVSSSPRCWTASWTWWKRPGGQWACSDDARSQIARSSTTGGGVPASRRTHAKEALARLPSPRRTARTLRSRVGTTIFSVMVVCGRNQQCCCHPVIAVYCCRREGNFFFSCALGWIQTSGNLLVVTVHKIHPSYKNKTHSPW